MTSTSLIGIFGKRFEEERLEASMIESFRSQLTTEVKRARQKLLRRAETKPLETATMLLRNYDHEDVQVRSSIKETLMELSKTAPGLEAIMTDMVHPSRNVRKSVQLFLGDKIGAHAVTYASFYEQTMLLVAMSKQKDIPVDDIMRLADLSKLTFMEGEVMEAVKDIGFCLDFVKHRYRSSEQLKEYVSDLLKMAPDLSRMGVYNGAIEEPLRKAMVASRHRDYNETREIIEERVHESKMRNGLHRIGKEVSEHVDKRPRMKFGELTGPEQDMMAKLHQLVDQVTSLVLAGKRNEAIGVLLLFEEEFLRDYDAGLGQKVRAQDPAALFVLYNVGITCVKLASSIISTSAEDVYQTEFRKLEEEPSIYIVMWPEAVMARVQDSVRQTSDESVAKA